MTCAPSAGPERPHERARAVPVVFDCNVYLQAMLSPRGPANACWQRARTGDVTLYVTPYIIAEIRALPDHPKLRRFRAMSHDRVDRFIEEVIDASTLIDDPAPAFVYPRDPDEFLVSLPLSPAISPPSPSPTPPPPSSAP